MGSILSAPESPCQNDFPTPAHPGISNAEALLSRQFLAWLSPNDRNGSTRDLFIRGQGREIFNPCFGDQQPVKRVALQCWQ